jgi:UDP-hydrolysing UDP-N-acetyl-D-glucosamine 2-epimerase
VSGNIDEKVRHSITKLSDYHFVASEGAKKRVIRLGEDPEFVFNTGCPSIDLAAEVLKETALGFCPYEKYGGVGAKPCYNNGYIVVMQHPVTTEYQFARLQVEETLHAIKDLELPVFWFWPNVDAGADGTSSGIRAFREQQPLPYVHFFKNMEGEDFLRLLFNAKCLVGNSSVGIRECAYMGVPVVNIGHRQNGRDRGENVLDVPCSKDAIMEAILASFQTKSSVRSAVYGGGDAGKNIAALLSTLPLKFSKTLAY